MRQQGIRNLAHNVRLEKILGASSGVHGMSFLWAKKTRRALGNCEVEQGDIAEDTGKKMRKTKGLTGQRQGKLIPFCGKNVLK